MTYNSKYQTNIDNIRNKREKKIEIFQKSKKKRKILTTNNFYPLNWEALEIRYLTIGNKNKPTCIQNTSYP